MQLSRRAALLLGSGSTYASAAALSAPVSGLFTDLSATRAPATTSTLSRPVPAGAVIATPGKARAALAKVPTGGTLVLRGGVYPETLGDITRNVTIQSYPGETAWLDGQGWRPSLFVASARVNLYDLGIRGYSPTRTGWLRGMAFYGGKSGGSVIDGCTFTGSTMSSLQFAVPLTITRNTFTNNGWSGLMGTASNGLVFTGNTIAGMNRDNHLPEPETAAIKLTRSAGVLIKNNTVTDVAGAYGIWLDVSCTNPRVIGNTVNGKGVGGRAGMKQTVEFELSEGGVFAGNTVTGSTNAGLRLFDAGHLRIWNNDLRGNAFGIWIQQDSRRNSGAPSANLSPTVAPWLALGNEVCNNTFGGPSQLWAYDSGLKTYSGLDMLGRVAGNWFAPRQSGGMAIRMGRKGSTITDSLTADQLKAALGSRGGPTYQGTSATAAAAVRQPVPSDIAALMK